jgi:hypothetical protein
MRFIIMHKTKPDWEGGAFPCRDLIGRVGELIGDLARAGILRAGEGLRASSLGARLTVSGGAAGVAPGPFIGGNELAFGFEIIRAATLDDAVAWAREVGKVLGDAELDVRPVTEPWDIGMGTKPDDLQSSRFMVLRKATAATEAGAKLTPAERASMDDLRRRAPAGHLTAETFEPSKRGRRCKNTSGGVVFTDGPFTESKELIAGYVIIDVPSLDEAARWCARYVTVVGTNEADILELDDAEGRLSQGLPPP